jgi:hypothetical protein
MIAHEALAVCPDLILVHVATIEVRDDNISAINPNQKKNSEGLGEESDDDEDGPGVLIPSTIC